MALWEVENYAIALQGLASSKDRMSLGMTLAIWNPNPLPWAAGKVCRCFLVGDFFPKNFGQFLKHTIIFVDPLVCMCIYIYTCKYLYMIWYIYIWIFLYIHVYIYISLNLFTYMLHIHILFTWSKKNSTQTAPVNPQNVDFFVWGEHRCVQRCINVCVYQSLSLSLYIYTLYKKICIYIYTYTRTSYYA